MIFGKKRQSKDDAIQPEQPVEAPKKKGFIARTVESAKNKVTQTKQKAQQTVATVKKIQLIVTVIATLFFIGNSIFWVFSNWGDFGNLLWVMLAVTVAYILVFVISLIKHRNSGKQMSMDNQKFKVQLKLWRALADLLFIAMSALTLAQNLLAWRVEGGIVLLLSMLFSGLVLFVKLLSTVIRLFKLNGKRKKLNKKQAKLNAKQQSLQEGKK